MLPSNIPEFEATESAGGARKRRGAGATIGVVLGVLVVIAALVLGGTALYRRSAASRPTVAVATAAPVAAGATAGPTTAPDADTAAIQQVIQRANQEQAQALQAKDPSGMSDTATPEYFQEMAQTNQDLLDNGVTSIQLVQLEWGPISVNGTTATATTYETWNTTYSDGSTDQSRDRNVYTLIQQQGSWKIQDNQHPDDAQNGNGNGNGNPFAVPTPGGR
jgi:uncharacterized iron-regulated membrane protein